MKIVITENEDFSKEVVQRLEAFGTIKSYNTLTRAELLKNVQGAEILFVRLRFKIDREVIDLNQQLKYILTATTGLDHIDVAYFESRGGTVISLKGATSFLSTIPSTAEHTWGLLLALIKNSFKAYEDVKNGHWRRDLFKGNNLSGKKIGIVGLGRVGTQVGNYAVAFNMQVGYFDIEEKVTSYQKFNTLDDLFKWADILTIHIPLNAETYQCITKQQLQQLQPHSVLINTSRGAIIHEADLIACLKNNKIKGYATDVLQNEIENQISNHPLVSLMLEGANILITPHIAGATYESMEMTELFIINEFEKLMA